ncbi:XK- protein 6, partial [Desmophyllum pertusum]
MNEGQGCVMTNYCCRLYRYIADERPDIAEEDGDTKLWKERAKCSRFSLLYPLFAALLFLADVGMDCEIAATHFKRGDRKWAAYTLGVVVFSLVFTDSLSAIFYLEDQRDSFKTEWLTRNNLQIFKTVRVIRGIQQQQPDNKQRYCLYISMLHDLSITGVVEAFTEEAPQ